ncbi:hypothetical protein SprV_0301200200 [Sparganum proliferum]
MKLSPLEEWPDRWILRFNVIRRRENQLCCQVNRDRKQIVFSDGLRSNWLPEVNTNEALSSKKLALLSELHLLPRRVLTCRTISATNNRSHAYTI